MGGLGFLPLVHLAALIDAAVKISGSSADTANKIIWILVVALITVVGLIAWFFVGPGTPKT